MIVADKEWWYVKIAENKAFKKFKNKDLYMMKYRNPMSMVCREKSPRNLSKCSGHPETPSTLSSASSAHLRPSPLRSSSCSQLLETLPLPNIKWICPTAPTRPVAIFGGFSCTTWFDVGDLSEEGPDDVEGMDASAAHIANLLSTEPANTKLGIAGFSTGAAMALYSASCCTHGQFGNGNPYPINISAVVALSGWLPRSRSLKSMVESSQDGIRRAASLPILMCQGREDDVVLYRHGEKSAEALRSSGYRNLIFKAYNRVGHYTVPEEMDDVSKWLAAWLGLDTNGFYAYG